MKKTKKGTKDALRKLWRAIAPHHAAYWSGYLIVCCRNFAINYLTAYLLYETTAAARQMDVPRLVRGTLLFLLLLLAFIAVDAFGLYLHQVTTQKITNGLRQSVQRRVLRAPLWKLEAMGGSRGEILSRMNHDIAMVETVYTSSLITPLMFLISGTGAFISIWRVSPAISLYLAALGALSLGAQYVFSKYQRKLSAQLQQRLSQLLVMLLCLVFLDQGRMELEEITYTLQLSGLVMLAFSLLGSTLLALERSLAAFDRVDALLSIEPEVLHEGLRELAGDTEDAVTVQNAAICFTPDKRLPIQKPLRIQAHRITALCGASGGGKSSLCKTLMGFYPYEGDILLMGRPLRSYALKTLRDSIAYVPQNSVIVPGTVEDNLRLGCRADLSPEELDRAVSTARCKEWIEQLPGQYAAPLEEGGLTLSGGQRQTLALARALLQEKPILLLDETFSAVSRSSAAAILADIKAAYPDRTILLVTHEPEIAAQCHTCISI